MGRRDDVISEAAALLREGGPDALTSVAVATRLGVTQPAIYRHVRDMQELITLASHEVVAELTDVMTVAVAGPEATWGDGTHVAHFASRVAGLIAEHRQAFAVIDRWRYDDGDLGAGIRSFLAAGQVVVAGELERAWRRNFGYDEPLDDTTIAAAVLHAELVVDDVVAVARSLDPSDDGPAVLARLLALRMFAGWCGYVIEMNRRTGLPTPVLGEAELSPPVYTS